MKVSDYLEVLALQRQHFDNELDRTLSIVSVWLNEDIEQVSERSLIEVNRLLNECYNVLLSSSTSYAIPFTQLTLGDFIDLETYATNTTLHHYAFAILNKKSKLNEWGERVYEPTPIKISERAISLLDHEANNYIASFNAYIEFRNKLLTDYADLFLKNDESVDITGLTPEEIKDLNDEIEKQKQREVYSWEAFLYWLADNQIANIDHVLNFPVVYAFNLASMKKMLNA